MIKPLFILSTLLICFAWSEGFCQGKKIDQYFQEDGLPNDLIKSVAFDSAGFLWVATDDGIVKMFGSSIVPLPTPSKVSSNFKQLLYTEKYGLLCSADNGILAINDESAGPNSVLFQEAFDITNWPRLIFPKTIYEASDNSLWFSDLENVYHLTDTTVKTYKFPEWNFTDHYSRSYQFVEVGNDICVVSQRGYAHYLDEDKDEFVPFEMLPTDLSVGAILSVTNSSFILGTDQGLYQVYWNADKKQSHSELLLPGYNVSSLNKMPNGDIVFGTWQNGAFRFKLASVVETLTNVSKNEEQVINAIAINNNDQTWLATDFGLHLVREVPFSSAFKDYTNDYIQDLLMLNANEYYFSDGYNVYYHNVNNASVDKYYHSSNGMILKLAAYKNGLAMSTNNGEIIIVSERGDVEIIDFSSKGRGIYSLTCDWQNNLWFIQDRGEQELVKWNKQQGEMLVKEVAKEGFVVRMTSISPYGEVYLGAYGDDNYLHCYNPLLDKFENLSKTIENKGSRTFSVIDIAFGKYGKLFLATEYGVWVWTEDEIFQLDLGSLSNEMVSAIQIDSKGGLWIANSNGLLWYKDNEYKIFNNNCGLPSKSIPYRTLKVDSTDRLVFGTISGMAKGEIREEILTSNPVISALQVSGKVMDYNSVQTFLDDEILHFNFASSCYPAKLTHYSYVLSDAGDTAVWTNLKLGDNAVMFSGVDPGQYTLKVKARSVGFFNWSNTCEYSFTVYKVWYERTWVVTLFYFIVFFSIFVYILLIRNKNKRVKTRLELIIEDRTRSLKQKNEELVTLNEDLNQANIIAEEAINTKDKFFSVVAHDLKSPFNALIGISELLTNENGKLPKETTDKLLKEIYNTSENTYKLLQNLLDWARSQTGNLKVRKRLFLLNEIIQENILMLDLNIKQKDLHIVNELDASLMINSDRDILSTVMRNLITNAIKFSPEGNAIHIAANREPDSIQIKVIDFGVGIEPEHLAKIFKVGEARSTVGTANETGTGLGLMLCQEYISKLNGSLQVESELGKGSEFVIKLPVSVPKIDLN